MHALHGASKPQQYQIFFFKVFIIINRFDITKKYLLHGYILGALIHTTAWDRHWEGDVTLKSI